MTEIMKLGPFIIRSSWLVLLAGGWFGFRLMKNRLVRDHQEPQAVLEMIGTSLLIMAFSWKLGPILFNPTMLLQNPWTALFMPGTQQHVMVGGVIVFFYVTWKMKKMNLSYMILLDILPFGLLSLLILYHLLIPQYGEATTLPWGISIQDQNYSYHPVGLYFALMEVPLLVWLWRRKAPIGSGGYASLFLLIYGITGMFVSFLELQTSLFAGMSTSQWLFLLMASAGCLIRSDKLRS